LPLDSLHRELRTLFACALEGAAGSEHDVDLDEACRWIGCALDVQSTQLLEVRDYRWEVDLYVCKRIDIRRKLHHHLCRFGEAAVGEIFKSLPMMHSMTISGWLGPSNGVAKPRDREIEHGNGREHEFLRTTLVWGLPDG
jgi:hypothetical protein